MAAIRNIIQRLLPNKDAPPILIQGLDCSGKTTFLYKLKLNEIVQAIPSLGTNVETITVPTFGKSKLAPSERLKHGRLLTVTMWDIGAGCGGLTFHRMVLRGFLEGGNPLGFIWMVDGSDSDRLVESKEGLAQIIEQIELGKGGRKDIPVLILVNKRELSNTIPLPQIIAQFAPVCVGRAFNVFDISTYEEYHSSGIPEALDWFREPLTNAKVSTTPASVDYQDNSNQKPVFVQKKEPIPESGKHLGEKIAAWIMRAEQDASPTKFLAQFDAIGLPAWDHYTHIRIAFVILTAFGRQKGKNMIFSGIERYIANSPQTRGRTFHVSMTYFWIQIVHFGIRSLPSLPSRPVLSSEASAQALASSNVSAETLVEGKTGTLQTTEVTSNAKPEDFTRFLFLNPYVADGNLWAEYYNKDTLMSPAAKEGMVLPDKKPLPSIVARDGLPLANVRGKKA